jgi:hypothetical protein
MSGKGLKQNIISLLAAVDEVLEENNTFLGDTPEERQLTREAIKGLTPKQIREAVTKYREAEA